MSNFKRFIFYVLYIFLPGVIYASSDFNDNSAAAEEVVTGNASGIAKVVICVGGLIYFIAPEIGFGFVGRTIVGLIIIGAAGTIVVTALTVGGA